MAVKKNGRKSQSLFKDTNDQRRKEFNGYFLRKVLDLLRPDIHSKRMIDGDGKLGVRNWR